MKRNCRNIIVLIFLYTAVVYTTAFPVYSQPTESDSSDSSQTDTLKQKSQFEKILLGSKKHLLYGWKRSSDYTFSLIEDPTQIKRVREQLGYRYQDWGGYLTGYVTSRYRVSAGVSLFYEKNDFKAVLSTYYADEYKRLLRLRLRQQHIKLTDTWKITATIEMREDDDLRLYGIGRDPKSDHRSNFLPSTDKDYGVFTQKRLKFQLVGGARINDEWEQFIILMYSERRFLDIRDNENDIDHVFDIQKIMPSKLEKLYYSELVVRYDPRTNISGLDGGFTTEHYFGIAPDLTGSQRAFIRAGADYEYDIPLIQGYSALAPHFHFNGIRNLEKDEGDVPFTELARHPDFRGVSSRHLYRIDNFSFVSSLELKQKISKRWVITAFYDKLDVSEDLTDTRLFEGPWAGGTSVHYHDTEQIIGTALLAYGTEGFRVRIALNIGLSKRFRSAWR